MRTWVKGGLIPLALIAPAVAVVAVMPGESAAASCRGMTIAYSISNGQLVVLTPDHLEVPYGGCVSFTNQTAATATVRVGSHYSQQIAPNASTSGSQNYVGTTPGRQPVTASSGSTPSSTAHGSITVGAQPRPSSSPTPARTTSPKAKPRPTQTASGGTGPQVAPSPHHRRKASSPSPSPSPGPGGVIQPPVSPPGPIQLTPSPTSSPAATAIVSGPIEPGSGRGIGLPAALAAFAIVGTGAALVRVIAAEAVDNPKVVGDAS